jgi:integrase
MSYSENTQKRYRIALKKLEDAGFTDFDKDAENVVKYLLLTYDKYNTRKSYLSAIFSTYNDDRSKIPKVLKDAINEEFKLQKEKEDSQELTPEQEENYLAWKDILKVQKQLKDKTDKNKTEWLEYIVVSLYTLTSPVRADYAGMIVRKSYRDSKKNAKKNVFVQTTKPYFVFTDYKTAETYGKVKVPVPKQLAEVITEYFEHLGHVPEYLLGNTYNPVILSNFIRSTFKKYTNKNVGINLLRHSYLTHMNNEGKLRSIKDKTAVAKKMMHSIETQTKYDLPKKGAESEEEDAKSQG